jgi:hypothetical protein
MRALYITLLLLLCFLTACGTPDAADQATVAGLSATDAPLPTQAETQDFTPTTTPAPVTPEAAVTAVIGYADPWDYCAVVETIDAPDERYIGEPMPHAIVKGFNDTSEAPGEIPEWLPRTMSWRCMEGKVYACSVGANLPCDEKANTSQEPSEAAKEACKQNPDFLAVKQKSSIYSWNCVNGTMQRGPQWTEPDAAGFLAKIWYEIKRP